MKAAGPLLRVLTAVACDVLGCQQFCSPLWQLRVQLRCRVLTPLVPACISPHSSQRVATARLSFQRVEKVNKSLLLLLSRESIQFRAVQRQKYRVVLTCSPKLQIVIGESKGGYTTLTSHVQYPPFIQRNLPSKMSGEAWLYLLAVLINAVNLFLQVFFTIMYSDLEW